MYYQGQIIDNCYWVEEVLHFGMCETYRAIDINNNRRKVIIKKIILNGSDNEKRIELFLREQNALIDLKYHPQIPTIFEGNEDYLVEDLIEGNTLNKILPNSTCINTEKSLIILLGKILKILDYIHSQNYIHRDVKPSNIIVSLNNEIYLIDFGAVGFINQNISDLNQEIDIREITLIGTSGYAPPEQFMGKMPHPSFDIYAVGIIAIEIITGMQPKSLPTYRGNIKIWNQIWNQNNYISISDDLKNVIEKMANDNSEQRYESVQETLKDLALVLFKLDSNIVLSNKNNLQELTFDSLISKYDFEQFLELNIWQELITLENNFLENQRCESFWLLVTYEKILRAGRIPLDNLEEELELLYLWELMHLGLVVGENELPNTYLIIAKPIYQEFFNEKWVQNKLAASSIPYAKKLKDWLDSNCQKLDKLLDEEELQISLEWILNNHKNISEKEDFFLFNSLTQPYIINRLETNKLGSLFKGMQDSLLENKNYDWFWLLLTYNQVLCKRVNLLDATIPQQQKYLEELQHMGFINSNFRVYKYISFIFHKDWIQDRLSENERPYANKFSSWVNSNCQDKSYLLKKTDEEWEKTQNWASNNIHRMNDLESKYLLCTAFN